MNATQDKQPQEPPFSLTNSPSHQPEPEQAEFSKLQDRRSSSEPAEFFEFFSDLSFEMSHAEDIIFGGKLIPLNQTKLLSSNIHTLNNKLPTTNKNDKKIQSFHKKRSESISELAMTRSDSTVTRLTRSSHSLDYKKLSRNSSLSSESSDKKCSSGFKVRKPRWYFMMFGFVKFPTEMDLRDIKNRQVRRSFDSGKGVPVSRNEGRRSSWRLLRVLSCKDHASVAVAASFGCFQRV